MSISRSKWIRGQIHRGFWVYDQRPRSLGVFGLGPSIREKDLLEEFEVFGRLESATIVMDRKGRSKGYMASLSFLVRYEINS